MPHAHVRGAAEVLVDGGAGDPRGRWRQRSSLASMGSRGEQQAATAACARVLGAVEERTVATESCVRVRWVAEEERTAATSISARAHGATANRGGAVGG